MKKNDKKLKNIGAILLVLILGLIMQALILPLYAVVSFIADWIVTNLSSDYSLTLSLLLFAAVIIATYGVFLFRTSLLFRAIFVTLPLQIGFMVFAVFVSGIFRLPNYIMNHHFYSFLPVYLVLPILTLIYLKITKRSIFYYASVISPIILFLIIAFFVR